MLALNTGKFGPREVVISIAVVFVLFALVTLLGVMNRRGGEGGLHYGDVFSSQEEQLAAQKAAEDHAIIQEVNEEGRPTERAKLKVLESLRAQ